MNEKTAFGQFLAQSQKQKERPEVESQEKHESGKKAVYVYSGGCSSDNLDMQRVEDYCRANNYPITHNPQKADVIFVGTCTLSKEREDLTINKIQNLRSLNPDAEIVPAGCLVRQNPERMGEIHSGLSLATKTEADWSQLEKILPGEVPIAEIIDPILIRPHIDWRLIEEFDAFPVLKQRLEKMPEDDRNAVLEKIFTNKALDHKKIAEFYNEGKLSEDEMKELEGYDEQAAILRIAKGCQGKCTYCAIKKSRGHLVSSKPDIVLDRFRGALKEGIKSFKLWADDIGAYGKDIGTDLASLLANILKEKENFKLEVLAGNPKDFLESFDKLLPLLKDPRIRYFNITVQSGSEKVLKEMNRPVNVEKLINALKQLHEEIPDLIIRTHYMVGFPGETDVDFQETVRFMEETKIYKSLIFAFSPRPNTPAEKMENQISDDVRQERVKILEEHRKAGSEKYYDGAIY
jgi:tRNA A37 methylthiotransferase MiaB